MSFSAEQIDAVKHAFYLANFKGELRTLPVENQSERVFIMPSQTEHLMGDQHSLEVVLSELLHSTILVTGDVGAPTVAFE